MNIINKETPLKVWHLIVIIFTVAVISFFWSMWNQVKANKVNISTIAKYLNQPKQTQVQPQKIPAIPEVKEKDGK